MAVIKAKIEERDTKKRKITRLTSKTTTKTSRKVHDMNKKALKLISNQ